MSFRKPYFFLAAFLLLPWTAANAYTLSGTVIGGEGLFLRWIYAVPATFDTFFVTLANPFNLAYSLNGLDEGGYMIFAYQDLNTNLVPDLDEPRGFYGDTGFPVIFQLVSDSEDVDITIEPPNAGGFSGTVSFDDTTLTGPTYIFASRSPNFDALPSGVGFLLTDNGNGDYTAFVDSFGVYYARAFMDLNANFQADPDEPQATYGGSTPDPIDIQPTDFPDGIDFVLEVSNAVTPAPRALVPASITLGGVYPNPFNNRATISFTLTSQTEVTLLLYDLLGREISVLSSGVFTAGIHEVAISGDGLSSGIYWIELQSGEYSLSKRMVLLK